MAAEAVHNDSTRAEGCVEPSSGLSDSQPTCEANYCGAATTLADPNVLVAVRTMCRPVLVVFNISNLNILLNSAARCY